MAQIYVTFGRLADSIPWLRQEAELRRRSLGSAHPQIATVINQIAVWFLASGDALQAEYLLTTSLKRCLPTDRSGNRVVALLQLNLSHLLSHIGREEEARRILRQMLENSTEPEQINLDIQGAAHSLLATIAANQSDLDAAEKHAQDAHTCFQSAMTWDAETQLAHLQSLQFIARVAFRRGDVDSSERLLMQIIQRGRRLGGRHHIVLADAKYVLAQIHVSRRNWKEAENLLLEALHVNPQGTGHFRPGVLELLLYLLWVEASRDLNQGSNATDRDSQKRDRRSATQHLQQIGIIANHQLSQILALDSEQQRLVSIQRVRPVTEFMLSYVMKFSTDENISIVFDLVQRRKLAAAEVLAVQQQSICSGKHPDLKDRLQRLHGLREQIAVEMFRQAEGSSKSQNRTLEFLLSERRELERNLASQIPEISSSLSLWDADRRAIAMGLPEQTTLIEFVATSIFNFDRSMRDVSPVWDDQHYLAFVLRAGEPDGLQLIDVGSAAEIDRWIHLFREGLIADSDRSSERSLNRSDRTLRRDMTILPDRTAPHTAKSRFSSSQSVRDDRVSTAAMELRTRLWDRICSALPSKDRLLIAVDGELAAFPWEAIPLAPGNYLGEARSISYCSVGREALKFGREYQGPWTNPVVLADPDFGMSSESPPRHVSAESLPRNQIRELIGSAFPSLPGTRLEGELIAANLGVTVWRGREAREPRLRRRISPRVLHLATHGFYIKNSLAEIQPGKVSPDYTGVLSRWSGPAAENPLLRSGLALAGANDWLAGRSTREQNGDGILFAEDVTGLNLLGTQLVVLSACDSGRGDYMPGEGVLGLRRSFLVAGAQTLVISLWSVADLATICLMDEFYRGVRSGKGCAESLRDAQKHLRETSVGDIRTRWLPDPHLLRMKHDVPELWLEFQQLAHLPSHHKPFANPYYWAAFVCTGDPGPLTFAFHSSHTAHDDNEAVSQENYRCLETNMNDPSTQSTEAPTLELTTGHDVEKSAVGSEDATISPPSNSEGNQSPDASPPSSLSELTTRLDQLNEKQSVLQQLFEQKLLIDQTRQQLLDKLHAELQEHKADLLLKTLQPMALDLIKLQDDMGKLTDAHRGRSEGNEAATALVNLLDQLGDEVREILTRFGFESFVVPEAKFDGKRQRVVKRVTTSDSAQDQCVVARIRPGFMYESRVLRPELVHVAVYEASRTS